MMGKNKDRRFGDHFVDHYNCSLSYRRKKRGRIRYLNWATELYGCLDEEVEEKILQELSKSTDSLKEDESVNREVRKAVEKLSSAEKQFIQLFYFEFKSYQEIARIQKKKIYKLERIHQRALGKLKIILADFVKERFKLEITKNTDCIICNSPFRRELDELIRNKKEEETYAGLIKIFKQKYGVDIKTPQVIIGHRKKHMV
jgi:RNA polymerase sigma factor (sigma-70 family)